MTHAPRLNDTVNQESYDSICIYGVSGVGKTWFGNSYGDRTFFLSIGGGDRTIKSPSYRKQGYNPVFKAINEPIMLKGRAGTVFDTITDTLDLYLDKYLDEFDVIFLDDQTALSYAARVKGLELNKKSSTLATAIAKKTIPLPEVNDFGPEQSLLTWFFDTYLKTFKQKKKYFVISAHERVVFKKRDVKDMMNPEPAVHRYQPEVVGKDAWAVSNYPGFFDQVWRMTMEPGIKDKGVDIFRNRVRTKPNSITLAKTRTGGVFNDELINPTLADVIKYLKLADKQEFTSEPYFGTIKNA